MSKPRQRWIVIPNWDEIQHYKDRDPIWIKNYRKILSKPEYLRLTLQQRGILHGLWLLYAESHRQVPVDTAYISRQLHGRVTKQMLDSLNHAGWVVFSASKPLAPVYQIASPEKEKEEETERDIEAEKLKIKKRLAVIESRPEERQPGFRIPDKAIKGAA